MTEDIHWQALVDKEINLQVPKKEGNFLVS
jgi:hypothetical protein